MQERHDSIANALELHLSCTNPSSHGTRIIVPAGTCPILTHWPMGKFEWNFRYVIFKWILVTDGWGFSCEMAQIWMSLDFTDVQTTLVQVMAWYCQATSHYLSQCWPRSLSPYGITRPRWVYGKMYLLYQANMSWSDVCKQTKFILLCACYPKVRDVTNIEYGMQW